MTKQDKKPEITVHILHHGLPLCGFSKDVPGKWPEGHKWTAIHRPDHSTCVGCDEEWNKMK